MPSATTVPVPIMLRYPRVHGVIAGVPSFSGTTSNSTTLACSGTFTNLSVSYSGGTAAQANPLTVAGPNHIARIFYYVEWYYLYIHMRTHQRTRLSIFEYTIEYSNNYCWFKWFCYGSRNQFYTVYVLQCWLWNL
jgi:hypothetical protein